MDPKKQVEKGTKKVKELAEHVEHLAANAITGGSVEHLSNAGNELLKAINKSVEDMSIPEESKKHLLEAERQTLLAVQGFIAAALKEIDRVEAPEKKHEEIKKIEIEKK